MSDIDFQTNVLLTCVGLIVGLGFLSLLWNSIKSSINEYKAKKYLKTIRLKCATCGKGDALRPTWLDYGVSASLDRMTQSSVWGTYREDCRFCKSESQYEGTVTYSRWTEDETGTWYTEAGDKSSLANAWHRNSLKQTLDKLGLHSSFL